MQVRWKPVTTGDNIFREELVTDGEIVLGFVERFFDDAPTYAHAKGRRLGAFSTDAAARSAVEAA